MSRNMKTSFKIPGTLGIMNLKTGRYFTSLWVVKIKMSENVKFWKKCGEIGLSYLAGHVCVLNRFSPVWLCVTPWTAAHQAPLSMGISQARILEWVAISFSRGSSQAWDWTCVSCTARRILYQWPTREIHTTFYPASQWLCSWAYTLDKLSFTTVHEDMHKTTYFSTLWNSKKLGTYEKKNATKRK